MYQVLPGLMDCFGLDDNAEKRYAWDSGVDIEVAWEDLRKWAWKKNWKWAWGTNVQQSFWFTVFGRFDVQQLSDQASLVISFPPCLCFCM